MITCPNCGVDLEEEGYDDYNEFNEIVFKCANCGCDFGEEE